MMIMTYVLRSSVRDSNTVAVNNVTSDHLVYLQRFVAFIRGSDGVDYEVRGLFDSGSKSTLTCREEKSCCISQEIKELFYQTSAR